MSVWLIGSGIYGLVVLFALALVRVASANNEESIDTATPKSSRAEFEQLIDLGSEGSHVAVQLETDTDNAGQVAGSRPGSRLSRSHGARKVSHRPQQSSGTQPAAVSQSIDVS